MYTADFLNHLEQTTSLKQSTIKSYSSFVKQFESFLVKYDDHSLATRQYLIWLIDTKKNKQSTINGKICMLKRYTKFLIDNDRLEESALIHVSRIKKRKFYRLPRSYDYSILKRIYLVLDNSSALNPTEKIILYFILNHATTYQELLSIKISDIDWQGRLIYIDKGDRFRYLYLGKKELIYLSNYLQFHKNQISLDKSLYLFQVNGKAMYEYQINKMIQKLSKIMDQKLTLRNLRNSFIKYAIDCDVNIIFVKEYLGLKSYTTLSRYEYITNKQIAYSLSHINSVRSKLSIITNKKGKKLNENIVKIFIENESLRKVLFLDKF